MMKMRIVMIANLYLDEPWLEVVFGHDWNEESDEPIEIEKSDDLFTNDSSWIRWWTFWLYFGVLNALVPLNIGVIFSWMLGFDFRLI